MQPSAGKTVSLAKDRGRRRRSLRETGVEWMVETAQVMVTVVVVVVVGARVEREVEAAREWW